MGAVEVGHYFHGGINMLKEFLVGGAEVVQAPFAIGAPGEAMLGAFSVAREADFAVAAVLGQFVAFGFAKCGGHLPIG